MKTSLYSINALAELTSLDRRRLKKELRDVPPKKTKSGEGYDLGEALHALFSASDSASASDSPKLKAERLKKLTADRELSELELSQKRGELIAVEDALLIFADVAVLARAQFLRLPLIASSLQGRGEGEIQGLLSKEVDKILTELSQLDSTTTLEAIRAAARGETPDNSNRKAA